MLTVALLLLPNYHTLWQPQLPLWNVLKPEKFIGCRHFRFSIMQDRKSSVRGFCWQEGWTCADLFCETNLCHVLHVQRCMRHICGPAKLSQLLAGAGWMACSPDTHPWREGCRDAEEMINCWIQACLF